MPQRVNLNNSRLLARVQFNKHRANRHYGFVRNFPAKSVATLEETVATAAPPQSELIDCLECGVNPAYCEVKNGLCGYCDSKNKSKTAANHSAENTSLKLAGLSRRRIVAAIEQNTGEDGDNASQKTTILPMSEVWQARLIFSGLAIVVIAAIYIIGQFVRF